MNFFLNTLPKKTLELVQLFQDKKPDFLNDFYLSGGTGLSLQLGHRESEDLDFFSKKDFNPQRLQLEIEQYGDLVDVELSQNTVNAFLNGVQLQFLSYPYPLLEKKLNLDGINISSILDIACTKLITVGIRGSKKDFIDMYFILQQFSLNDLFEKMEKKYSKSNYSETHILKSLIYFDDADNQPMPRMHEQVKWEEVKSVIEKVTLGIEI